MFKSRTMWAAGWVQSLAHVNLRAPEGWLCVEASPGDTSYPGLTKTVASGISTSVIGRNQGRGFVGRTVGRGQKIFGEKARSAVDHCDRDVDPVYLRLGEGEVHRGKRSRWQKECGWGCRRVDYLEDVHFAISYQGEI